MKKIRLFIAADQTISLTGLRSLLTTQPDIELVGETSSETEIVGKIKETNPDIVLLDTHIVKRNPFGIVYQLKQYNRLIKILVLAVDKGYNYFFEVAGTGASSYYVKNESPREFLDALRAMAQGDVYVSPSLPNEVLTSYLMQTPSGVAKIGRVHLTSREKEILKLVAEGFNNQQIAQRLSLGVSTIRTHRANIIAKLGLPSRNELVRHALRNGFISLSP